MLDSSVADQMTQLTLKLLEQNKLGSSSFQSQEADNNHQQTTSKKLKQERESMDMPGLQNRPDTALKSALRRRKDLLKRLWEQQLMDEHAPTHVWQGTHGRTLVPARHPEVPPMDVFPDASPPLPLPPEPPMILQHQVPQSPATIIQQLPQQPLIAQISPPQAFPTQRSGNIKEDMVEMMLMQNAQMYQILMQNMMLKVLPPGPTGPHASPQDQRWACPGVLRAERQRQKQSPVHHHHHHYAPSAQLQVAPAPALGAPVDYTGWPPVVATTALPHTAGFLPTMRQVAESVTALPALSI